MTEVETRRPRGRPEKPEPLFQGQELVSLKGCPDCDGRGWFLIQPFATGGSNGAGGIGNMCQCLTCSESRAYWDKHGKLPPDVEAAMAEAAKKKGSEKC